MISFMAHSLSSAVSESPRMRADNSAGQVVRASMTGFQVGPGREGAKDEGRRGVNPGPFGMKRLRPQPLTAGRSRISPASSCASAIGSIGWLTTASARDQVASQPSSARPTISSAGGQL